MHFFHPTHRLKKRGVCIMYDNKKLSMTYRDISRILVVNLNGIVLYVYHCSHSVLIDSWIWNLVKMSRDNQMNIWIQGDLIDYYVSMASAELEANLYFYKVHRRKFQNYFSLWVFWSSNKNFPVAPSSLSVWQLVGNNKIGSLSVWQLVENTKNYNPTNSCLVLSNKKSCTCDFVPPLSWNSGEIRIFEFCQL